jgi:hypothetical protein
LTTGTWVTTTRALRGGNVGEWTAIFIIASSVSLGGLVTSFAFHRRGRALGEREMLKRGIERSLSDLDDKIWKIEIDTLGAGEGQSAEIRETLGRMNAMKSDLIGAEQKIVGATQEEWGRIRDEILGSLDQARRYPGNEGPAIRHA